MDSFEEDEVVVDDPFADYDNVAGEESVNAAAIQTRRDIAADEQAKRWQNFETVFTNAKAGMAGVDKEHVKKVVYEMSKDSPHFKNEQRKQKQTEERIAGMLSRAKQLSAHELEGHTRQMDKKLATLKAAVDLTRIWLVVDMDAFYAAVEELHDPSLKSKPMAVGGIGMVCTANYEARKYGVRAAMPGFIAKRLCPDLVFAKPDFTKYTKAAKAFRLIFQEYDPDFDCGSLDEAYLDVTDYCSTHGTTGSEVAQAIRQRVHTSTQLTCSCGVAPNRLLAKICADINKPNGQAVLQPDPAVIKKFMDDLPVRKVPMIGRVTEQVLRELGITKCADLTDSRGLLGALYSNIATDHFMAVSLGIGGTHHSEPAKEGEAGRKGMSVERTFRAISSPADLEAKCAELAEKLSADLLEEGLKGRTLTLKLKATNFEVRTRAATLSQAINTCQAINTAALRLLRPEMPIQIRLMGLRMSNFLEVHLEPGQQSIASFVQSSHSARAHAVADAVVPSEQLSGTLQGVEECGSQHMELSLRDWGGSPGSGQLHEPKATDGAQAPEQAATPSLQRMQGETDREPSPTESAPEDSSMGTNPRGKQGRTWECRRCTYAGNHLQWLRCEVCDSLRGSTTPPEHISSETQPPERCREDGTHHRADAHPPDQAGQLGHLPQVGAPPHFGQDPSTARHVQPAPEVQQTQNEEDRLNVASPSHAAANATKSVRGRKGKRQVQQAGVRTLETFMKRSRM